MRAPDAWTASVAEDGSEPIARTTSVAGVLLKLAALVGATTSADGMARRALVRTTNVDGIATIDPATATRNVAGARVALVARTVSVAPGATDETPLARKLEGMVARVFVGTVRLEPMASGAAARTMSVEASAVDDVIVARRVDGALTAADARTVRKPCGAYVCTTLTRRVDATVFADVV